MANHVYFNIELNLDAGQHELVEKLAESCREEQGDCNSTFQYQSYEVQNLPIYPVPYDEDDWYSWGCENIGAKWIDVEDWNEHQLTGHSAWSPPTPFLHHLIQYIYDKVGGTPSATMTYEDEFRNFIGVMHCYVDDGMVCDDIEEADGEDLNYVLEQWSGWDTSDPEFSWWDLKEAKNGTEYEPQEVIDDMVYGFFEDCEVRVRHD